MKNFLFLSIDDLNDWTGGLGGYAGPVHTPNLDALMAQGTTFANAFSQAAICNPSRASVLTGKAPQKTGVFNNQRHDWEDATAPAETLFGVFKAAGYESHGVGKLFHTGASTAANAAMFDSYRYMGKDAFGVTTDGKPAGPYTGAETPADARRADFVVDFLNGYVPDPAHPLLLSVGLLKPHTDWVVPQAFFDLYPLDQIVIDAVPGDTADIPQFVLDNAGQIHPWSAADVPNETVWKQLIQAYLATISFMDAQVGKILDALDASAIGGSTAVVLWSDHGYHLGDKDVWHKFTLWDNAAKAPLILRDPGTVPAGAVVTDAVELLDIFPTMLDMAGLPPGGLELDGKSLVPYFTGGAPAGPAQAFTWMYGNVSIRTNDYRYSLYEDGSVELYHVAADPELLTNLAGHPDHAAAAAALRAALVAKFNLVGYGDPAAVLTGTAADEVFADLNGGTVEGGAGDDVYFVSPDVTVVERPGGGRDLIVTETLGAYTLPAFVEDLEMKVFSGTVTGNDGGNVITANARAIYARGGDDTVFGGNLAGLYDLGDGDDQVYGHSGNDTIRGGAGHDLLRGQWGADTLDGGAGDDTAEGGSEDDLVLGGTGADHLFGEAGADVVSGEDGADRVDGGTDDDWLFGGTGNDTLLGRDGADHLFGGADDDFLLGGAGGDTLTGEWGHDVLSGEAGDDVLRGNQYQDWLFGGAGDDSLFGDEGFDNLYGGVGNDLLMGGANQDTLVGEFGADVLSGEHGDDLLRGDAGDDWLFGGEGRDTAEGGAGDDHVFGGADDDTLLGDAGADTLLGEWGADVLSGGDGDDALRGDQGDDWLFGMAGADLVQGGTGADHLFGGLGADTLEGGDGADVLSGEQGDDCLAGGAGDDLFVFADLPGGGGQDRIAGFDALGAGEKIDLTAVSAIADFADLRDNHMVQAGAHVVIDLGGGASVTLESTALADLLDGEDFLI